MEQSPAAAVTISEMVVLFVLLAFALCFSVFHCSFLDQTSSKELTHKFVFPALIF